MLQAFNPFQGWRISSPFGWRIHPIQKVRKHHNGIDLVKEHRFPITPFVTGKVIRTGHNGNAGIQVVILDSAGYEHRYFHLDSYEVYNGQYVGFNDIIGRQGNTGGSTGSHLHYEVRNPKGEPVEPTEYLRGVYMDYQAQLDAMGERLKDLETQNNFLLQSAKWCEPPEWFKKEFKEVPFDEVINDMRGTEDFWRNVATTARMIKWGL